jgi:HEAT repeat protein
MGWLRRQWWYLTLPRAQPAAADAPVSELSENEQRRVRDVLRRFDTDDAATQDDCWKQLPSSRLVLPLLREAFPNTRRMEARISMVYEATFFARVSEDAFQLGLLGLRDPSKHVRDRACGVLAYSLREDALPALRALLRADDEVTRRAAEGAVDAIKHQNHHLYWDQDGPRGQTFWVVNRGDDPYLPEVGRDIDRE